MWVASLALVVVVATGGCRGLLGIDGASLADPDAPVTDSSVDSPIDTPIDAPIDTPLTCTGYAAITDGFPVGATYRGNNVGAAWDTARASCMADGADLVVIDNAAEAAAVVGLVQDGASPFLWIGVFDNPATPTDNDFVLVRGGAAVFLPWSAGQPNGGDQNCVLLEDQPPPQEMFDFQCTAPQVYVCECLP